MSKGKDVIVRGAVVLGFATFIAKLLGAFYRVPLTNLIGSFGLGLYQMVFPVYALLLDFSGAAVPIALSRLISAYQGNDKMAYAKACLKKALKIFIWVGASFSILMSIFSKTLAGFQGNQDAWLGYVFLAPAIIPVCIMSCFRGYFQGLLRVVPTAISQITEQVVKLALGLLFAYLAMPNVVWAVAGATLAVTISEVIALVQIYLTYRAHAKKNHLKFATDSNDKVLYKNLLKMLVPITLTGIILPLSQVLDSFMIINLLSSYRADATNLYGLLSGVAVTIVGLPVAMCHGVCTVTLPSVSSAEPSQKRVLGAKALSVTLLFSLLSVVVCYFFASSIVNLLFRSLNSADKEISVLLLKTISPSILFLAVLHTENSLLIAYGKQKIPPITLFVGVVAKTLLNIFLIPNQTFNVYGGAIGLIACYFLPCLINLIILISLKVNDESKVTQNRQLSNG